VVEELRYARTRARRPLKVTLPGPYTLSGRLRTGPGEVYSTRDAAAEAFVPILRSELESLVAEGASHIQIDDPSPAIHPDAPSDFAALFNAAVEPIVGQVRLGAHLCFGNYLGRPLARRTYRPVLDAMLGFRVDELVLEFANREMAEVDLLGEIAAAGRDVAAGVVDVKNYHLESPEEVAERTDAVLAAGVPAERLTLVPDCGFSQTARWATLAKLRALVAGRDLVAGRRT
jgi:5-methyltetrahydropteroyltriglutamate--homocysteine methyltransferase